MKPLFAIHLRNGGHVVAHELRSLDNGKVAIMFDGKDGEEPFVIVRNQSNIMAIMFEVSDSIEQPTTSQAKTQS